MFISLNKHELDNFLSTHQAELRKNIGSSYKKENLRHSIDWVKDSLDKVHPELYDRMELHHSYRSYKNRNRSIDDVIRKNNIGTYPDDFQMDILWSYGFYLGYAETDIRLVSSRLKLTGVINDRSKRKPPRCSRSYIESYIDNDNRIGLVLSLIDMKYMDSSFTDLLDVLDFFYG